MILWGGAPGSGGGTDGGPEGGAIRERVPEFGALARGVAGHGGGLEGEEGGADVRADQLSGEVASIGGEGPEAGVSLL